MKIEMVSSSGVTQNVENSMNDSTTKDAQINKANTTKSLDEANLQKVEKAIDKLNKKAEETNYDVRFAIYKDTDRIIIETVDKTNNQVISTFPPKQILDMAAMIDKEFKILDKKI